MGIKIGDERALALGNPLAQGVVIHHAGYELARGRHEETLHALVAHLTVNRIDELPVLRELIEHAQVALLPGGDGLAPVDGALGVFLKRPFHEVVNVFEMVVERHAADAAVLGDVGNGNLGERLCGQLSLKRLLKGPFCKLACHTSPLRLRPTPQLSQVCACNGKGNSKMGSKRQKEAHVHPVQAERPSMRRAPSPGRTSKNAAY